jgi:hypothetical protein
VRQGQNKNLNRNLASPPSPPSPLAEAIPATKRPRLEKPISGSTDEASYYKAFFHTTLTAVSLPADDADTADADPLKGTRASNWTSEEDA